MQDAGVKATDLNQLAEKKQDMSGPKLQNVVEQRILGNLRTPYTPAAHLQQQTPSTSDGSFIDDSVRKQQNKVKQIS